MRWVIIPLGQSVCNRDIILLSQSIRDGLLFPSAGLFASGHYTLRLVHQRWVIIPLGRSVCNGDIILLGQSIRDGLLFPSAGLFASGHYPLWPVHQRWVIKIGRAHV